MERALIDACGRGLGQTYFQLIRDNTLDLNLGCLHAELAGISPASALASAPLTSIAIRHTVGLADPIYREDIPAGEILDDCLPQALEEYISAQGIAFLKVKVSGDMDVDRERLRAIAGLLDQRTRSCQITLDGNEQYCDMDAFSMLFDDIQLLSIDVGCFVVFCMLSKEIKQMRQSSWLEYQSVLSAST